jgi:hypothetical protein
MGRVIVWLVEVGSGLYALAGALVIFGGFVMFLIEMTRHLSTQRSAHPKVNVYVNEVHIHVHSTASNDTLRSLSRYPELPSADESRNDPDEGSS